MSRADDRQRAIAAARNLIGRRIEIRTEADFTPPGKRSVRVIRLQPRHRYASTKGAAAIRLYVGGRIYRTIPATPDNAAMAKEWLAAG